MQGESVLNFPRLSFETNFLTGIAITNPSTEEAPVKLTAYDTEGALVTGIDNPSEPFIIAPGEQKALLVGGIFGEGADPSTVSWFQATSPVDGLTGFFLLLDSSVTILDGADLPPVSKKIVFNQVRSDLEHTTEINVVNPGNVPATVQLQLITADSAPLIQALLIPAKGVARWDVQTLFGTNETPSGAYLLATSDTEIAGFALIYSVEGDSLGPECQKCFRASKHSVLPSNGCSWWVENRTGPDKLLDATGDCYDFSVCNRRGALRRKPPE